mmetsp:Transcript_980/g.2333  ORF Transcript_980/g.2333 Transcript_980/m.2333 type:complete len:214 (-) Transcript_980:293-934(-)|eukprot:CAMPEP_0171506592 /NCGR_PEP_ID=MMETSP0958-20121227/13008_1 /TAXON_ID=87120 /ORGANISM="Aurantiochytrium limacinum, Strain ATCCMYA-1381" /LENGTH=213 /DNA_ID=CAMNT_0012043153 /DNA_START=604 /DNA_END=1245 /DNA_ORIENTATION=+
MTDQVEQQAKASPTLTYASRKLYGGAITTTMPKEFVDISTVREVPDHQEVFSHQDTDRSVIVEILELSEQSNETAGKYFFEDLAGANGSEETVVEYNEVGVPASTIPCLTRLGDPDATANVIIGTQLVAKFHEAAHNKIRIFLCNIRLPKYSTDLLISMNTPVSISAESSSASSVQAAGISLNTAPEQQTEDMQIFRNILESFEIPNLALFGG